MKTKCGNSLYHICLLPSKILTCLWIRFCMLERNVHLSRKEFFWKRSQNDIREELEEGRDSYFILNNWSPPRIPSQLLYSVRDDDEVVRWDEISFLCSHLMNLTQQHQLFTNYTLHPRKRVNYACAYQTFSTRLGIRRLMECRVHFCLHIFQKMPCALQPFSSRQMPIVIMNIYLNN